MTRRFTVLLLVAILLASIVGTGTPVAAFETSEATTKIDSCAIIDEPGRYVLTQDIENANEDVCVDIRSSNVRFDGKGYTVTGSQTADDRNETAQQEDFPAIRNVSVGIGVDTEESLSNVTVTNTAVANSTFGVYAEGLEDGLIEGVTATDNAFGVFLHRASHSVVTETAADRNSIKGIVFDAFTGGPTTGNAVTDSVVRSNEFGGVGVYNVSDSLVHNVTAVGSPNGSGIIMGSAIPVDNNTVVDSTSRENFLGVEMDNSSGSAVRNVNASENALFGVRVSGYGNAVVENVTVAENDLNGNPVGVGTFNMTDVRVTDNAINGSRFGLFTRWTAQLTVAHNEVTESDDTGMLVGEARSPRLVDNRVRDSGYVGIDFANSQGGVLVDNTVANTRGVQPGPEAVPFPSANYLLSNASNTVVVNDEATGANASGIVVRNESEDVVLFGVTAKENADDGVAVNNSSTVAVALSTANDNGDDGIDVRDSRVVLLAGNTLDGNGDQPVEITDSEDVRQVDSVDDLGTLLEVLRQQGER